MGSLISLLVRNNYCVEFDPAPYDDGKIMVSLRQIEGRLLGQKIHEDSETALVLAIESCYDSKPKELYKQWKEI